MPKNIIFTEDQYRDYVRFLTEAHSQLYRDAIKAINDEIYSNPKELEKEKGIVTKFTYPAEIKPGEFLQNGAPRTGKTENSLPTYYYSNGEALKNQGHDSELLKTYNVKLKALINGDDKTGSTVGDSSIFAVGNTKIGKDTVILNLSSAMQCPASGYCLVAAACYAKSEETHYPYSFARNLRNQNMVKLLEKKDKLDLLFTALKLYIIDCEQEGNKINFVRVNEAGDFPSPKIVSVLDSWAAELEHGVKMDLPNFNGNVDHPVILAAYTAQGNPAFCKAFRKVKHMVVNASLPNIDIGDKSYIKRYFYAISENAYDSLPDTSFIVNKHGERVPLVRECQNTNILKNKGYYFKCTCDVKDIYGMQRKCTQCQVCYNKARAIVIDDNGNKIGTTKKYYVVIKAHGTNSEYINSHEKQIDKARRKLENDEDDTQ